MLTGRIEKHKGITLIVDASVDWISIVHDETGFVFEGPAMSDTDVRRIARIAINAIKTLAGG